MSISIASLKTGDIISIEAEGVAITGLKVRENYGVRYVVLPGYPGGKYLTDIPNVVVTSVKKALPTTPGWYQSQTGRSMYLLNKRGVWFEIERKGRLIEKSAAWVPDADNRPFTPVGSF